MLVELTYHMDAFSRAAAGNGVISRFDLKDRHGRVRAQEVTLERWAWLAVPIEVRPKGRPDVSGTLVSVIVAPGWSPAVQTAMSPPDFAGLRATPISGPGFIPPLSGAG